AGIPADAVMAPAHRDALVMIARRLADRAALHEASARVGTRALSWRSAWAVLAAAGIYGDIARTVARRGAHAWDRRVTTGKAAKLAWIARAAAQASRRHAIPDTPRDPLLWTRPR
ncbi:squalene/phytoene synthase family protein, partial [Sphingomonas sp. CCH9-F2]